MTALSDTTDVLRRVVSRPTGAAGLVIVILVVIAAAAALGLAAIGISLALGAWEFLFA